MGRRDLAEYLLRVRLRYNKSLASNNGLYYGYDAADSVRSRVRGLLQPPGVLGPHGWHGLDGERVGAGDGRVLRGDQRAPSTGMCNGTSMACSMARPRTNGQAAQQFPVPSASSGQVLEIGYGSGSVFDAEELNDIGIWKTDLAGTLHLQHAS